MRFVLGALPLLRANVCIATSKRDHLPPHCTSARSRLPPTLPPLRLMAAGRRPKWAYAITCHIWNILLILVGISRLPPSVHVAALEHLAIVYSKRGKGLGVAGEGHLPRMMNKWLRRAQAEGLRRVPLPNKHETSMQWLWRVCEVERVVSVPLV